MKITIEPVAMDGEALASVIAYISALADDIKTSVDLKFTDLTIPIRGIGLTFAKNLITMDDIHADLIQDSCGKAVYSDKMKEEKDVATPKTKANREKLKESNLSSTPINTIGNITIE